MADHQFQFVNVGSTTPCRISREAILRPIFPVLYPKTRRGIIKRVHQLVEIWRDKIDLLRGEGWKPTQGITNQYTRNCPPSFVFDNFARPLRLCGNWRICPWCWGREVAEDIWHRLEPVFSDENRKLRGDDEKGLYKLIGNIVEDRLPLTAPVSKVAAWTAMHMEISKRRVPKDALGAAFVAVEYPGCDEDCSRFSVRTLALIPGNTPSCDVALDWTISPA